MAVEGASEGVEVKYDQIIDGEWNDVPKEWRLGCCDCGLVHDMNFRIVKEGKVNYVQVQMFRNKRATNRKRNAKGIKIVKMEKK